jgi:hypothetical protein
MVLVQGKGRSEMLQALYEEVTRIENMSKTEKRKKILEGRIFQLISLQNVAERLQEFRLITWEEQEAFLLRAGTLKIQIGKRLV